METAFQKVKNYLLELDILISYENEDEQVFVVQNEEIGIKNMIIGCSDPILIMEQYLFDLKKSTETLELKRLLQLNRDIVHGALVLDESGVKIIYRDTLQLENLDKNELDGSLNSLGLFLSEFSNEIIKLAK
jgi:hypothetical protein